PADAEQQALAVPVDQTVPDGATSDGAATELTAEDLSAPDRRPHRFGPAIGVPTAPSKHFSLAVRRLGRPLLPHRPILAFVLVTGVASAVLNVLGPRLLGKATDEVVKGVLGGGIDYGTLHGLLLQAVGLYVGSTLLSILTSWLIAGVVQNLMFDLRRQA